jgi:glycosyltransferase involved in cell wall biosynthesis
LSSFIDQNYKFDELIICDDNSKDSTKHIIKKFAKDYPEINLKLYENNTNLGLNVNFVQSINLCSGELIFLADQDDIWDCTKIETIVRLYKNTKFNFFISDMNLINEFGEQSTISWLKYIEEWGLNRDHYSNGCASAATKYFFTSCLPIPHGKAYDNWFGYCSRKLKTRFFVDNCLMSYRLHSGGLSSQNHTEIFGATQSVTFSNKKHNNRKRLNLSKLERFIRLISTHNLNINYVKLRLIVFLRMSIIQIKWRYLQLIGKV